METTTDKKNLFAGAKTVAKKSATAEKVIFTIGENEFPELSEYIKKLYDARREIKNAEAQEAMMAGLIKPFATNKFLEQYQKQHSRPESFILKTSTGEALMVLPTDRYRPLDESAYEELKGKYGHQAVERKDEYIFNSDILGKNMDAVSAAIMSSPDISEADKAELVQVKTTYAVRKGTIDHLNDFGEKMFELFADVAPVVQLKNSK